MPHAMHNVEQTNRVSFDLTKDEVEAEQILLLRLRSGSLHPFAQHGVQLDGHGGDDATISILLPTSKRRFHLFLFAQAWFVGAN